MLTKTENNLNLNLFKSKMKRGLFFSVIFILILVSSFASANFLTNSFGKITGSVIRSCETNDDCNTDQYCNWLGFCSTSSCTSGWSCGDWSACGTNSQRTRTCTDLNNCASDKQETDACTYVAPLKACTPTDSFCAGGGVGDEMCSYYRNVPLVCVKDTVNNCIKFADKTACTSTQKCEYDLNTKKASCVQNAGTGCPTTACTVGTKKCGGASGAQIQTCVVTSSTNSCGVWGTATACTTAGQTCQTTNNVAECKTTAAACTPNCNLPDWSTVSCVNNQQTRSCTSSNCATPKTETQGCISTTPPTCQWGYEDISKAFCYDDGRKRILATQTNAPCTGNPDNTKCSATGGWKNNVPGTQGWSCDVGSCTPTGTANKCGWNGCFPAVGTTDPNCKTPDGELIINDPAGCYCDYAGCFGTGGGWKNYACLNFAPSSGLRVGIANGDISMAMIGLSNSCSQIQNEAGNVVANYLLGYYYFEVPLGSSTNGPPSGWLERYNFVKALYSSKKSLVAQSVSRVCQNMNIPQCSQKMADIGLVGDGYGSSWRQWRLDQALSSCFVYGIGSATVYGNGDIKILAQDLLIGNAFDPTLDLTSQSFKTRCQDLLKGGTECTATNTLAVCGNAKTCYGGLCCTPAPSAATCPPHIMYSIACDSSNKQTRTCGSCDSVITEKRDCPAFSIVSTSPSGTLGGYTGSGYMNCRQDEATIIVWPNRISECRYSKTSTDYNLMKSMPSVTNVGDRLDIRAEVPISVGLNTFNVKCKLTGTETYATSTISFTNPSAYCSSNPTSSSAPTLDFNYGGSYAPVSVVSGGSVVLNWSATNINRCQMFRNGTLYNDNVFNSYGLVTPSQKGIFCVGCVGGGVINSSKFTLTCNGPGGTVSKDMTVNPNRASSGTAALIDTIAPKISSGKPSGTLLSETTQTTISTETDEESRCKYALTSKVEYDKMPNSFTYTSNSQYKVSHSRAGFLVSAGTNKVYIRCVDLAGNKDTEDYMLTFSTTSSSLVNSPSASAAVASSSTPSTSKRSSSENCNGCLVGQKCYNLGHRSNIDYCSDETKFVRQKNVDESCGNNFECKSNLCSESKCTEVNVGFFKKLVRWVKGVFGGN